MDLGFQETLEDIVVLGWSGVDGLQNLHILKYICMEERFYCAPITWYLREFLRQGNLGW